MWRNERALSGMLAQGVASCACGTPTNKLAGPPCALKGTGIPFPEWAAGTEDEEEEERAAEGDDDDEK